MRHAIALTALTLALPAAAQEESRLDRMERLTGAMMTTMYSNALGGDLSGVDMELATGWDDEMRAAASCVLDGYIAESSEAEVDAVFDRMETAVDGSAAEIAALSEEMADMGGIVSEARGIEINRGCGMVGLQMDRMRASGLMDEMIERGSFE